MPLDYLKNVSKQAHRRQDAREQTASPDTPCDGDEVIMAEQFARIFRFQVAFDDADKKKAFALRKAVFIDEQGYHMATRAGGSLEVDEYDEVAAQCILVHRESGATAGCFRVVTPHSIAADTPHKLPVEQHGSQGIRHETLHPRAMPRDRICEASRLAIAAEFRHHGNAKGADNTSMDPAYRLILPGLFLAAYSLAELLGNNHLYAMMAPTLPRLLKKSGFNFIRLGDTIEFHGKRSVFYINRDLAGSGMQNTLAPLHRHILDELAPQATRYLMSHRPSQA